MHNQHAARDAMEFKSQLVLAFLVGLLFSAVVVLALAYKHKPSAYLMQQFDAQCIAAISK